MPCQPCEARKARLAAAVNSGEPLPAKDYAFYAGWVLAGLGIGAAVFLYVRRDRGQH